jgi:hypothetical protein
LKAILARAQPQILNPVTPSRRISTLVDQLDISIVIDSPPSRPDSTLNTTMRSWLTESGGKVNRFTRPNQHDRVMLGTKEGRVVAIAGQLPHQA